jgi:integrase/recombinase XerC
LYLSIANLLSLKEVQSFLQYLEFEKRYSTLTVQAYHRDLEQFFLFLKSTYGDCHILQIKHIHIRAWLAQLKNVDNSSKTINRKISTLKSFFKFALRNQWITELPTTKLVSPKTEKRLPTFLQESQIEHLFDNTDFGTKFSDKTERLILEILYNTGMRRAELCNLKTKQIEFGTQLIRIIGKGNKERLMPMVPDLAGLIKDYILAKTEIENADNEYLLILPKGKPLYEKYVYLVVKKYLATVSTQAKKSPHVLRHTFATHVLNNGAQLNAVKELLGHASLAATQIYTHNSIEKLKETFKKAHPKA